MTVAIESGQPPVTKITPWQWLKRNLFSTWYNCILTAVSLFIVFWAASNLITWAFSQAQWQVIEANFRLFFVGRYPVQSLWRVWITLGIIVALGGISWGVFASDTARLFNRRILTILFLCLVIATCFLVAIPIIQSSIILIDSIGMLSLWLVWITLGIVVALGGISWVIFASDTARLFNRRILIVLCLVAATCFLVVIPGGIESKTILIGMLLLLIVTALAGKQIGKRFPDLGDWLPLLWLLAFSFNIWFLLNGNNVRLNRVSGLMLTIPVAIASIVLCFPFGVLLALGRQSDLPVIRWLSIAYIELVRGVPLITIIFMAQVMLPLVLPPNVRVDRIIRAVAGFTIYSAAYLAENVRGGLQSIPRGQEEAAKALGLNPAYTLWFIILPQALRTVIPSMVGQFIALFKDTSLLAIVGLTDLLGMSQSIIANPKYLGRYSEVYLFVAVIYFICCYAMSLASRRLEHKQ